MERRDVIKGLATIGAAATAPSIATGNPVAMVDLINEHKRHWVVLSELCDAHAASEQAVYADRNSNPPLAPIGVSPNDGTPSGGYVDVAVIDRDQCEQQINRHHAQYENMFSASMAHLVGEDAVQEAREKVEQSRKAAFAQLDRCIDEYHARPVMKAYERENARWHQAAQRCDDALLAVIFAVPRDSEESHIRRAYLNDNREIVLDFLITEAFGDALIDGWPAAS